MVLDYLLGLCKSLSPWPRPCAGATPNFFARLQSREQRRALKRRERDMLMAGARNELNVANIWFGEWDSDGKMGVVCSSI